MTRSFNASLTKFAMTMILFVAGLAAFTTSASAQPIAHENVTPTPEPSSIVVLAIAGAMLTGIVLFNRYRTARNTN